MNIEYAKLERMSERGSSLLRLIQNNHMPLVDLLVREAIQNSLDAVLENEGHVNVEFIINQFEPRKLNRYFEGIQETLNERFKDNSYHSLIIRDSRTTGLTGPLRDEDISDNKYGNLQKLIYHISIPQNNEGAGGSWGLGKTVYFRFGIGLIIYYSRVKTKDGSYQDRLAACLVENEEKTDAILSRIGSGPQRGIAWWGKSIGNNKTIPITDSMEIEKILDCVGIDLYSGRQTGTCIIIPYINCNKLLANASPETNGDTKSTLYWNREIKEYISVAVQRWYAPRLSNKCFPYGAWLNVSINGDKITREVMLPFFKIVQYLYCKAMDLDTDSFKDRIIDKISINRKAIRIRNYLADSSDVGYISYTKLTREQLLMNSPYNYPEPYLHILEENNASESNNPVVLFCRKPGMVVNYKTTGDWTDKIPVTNTDEYILGIFVVNSRNRVAYENLNLNLDEYFRKCEKADHANWEDITIDGVKPSIIRRAKTNVRKSIAAEYVEKDIKKSTGKNLGLSRRLADLFLPAFDFGNQPSQTGGTSGSQQKREKRKHKIIIESNIRYSQNYVQAPFKIFCGKQYNGFLIELYVQSEAGKISAKSWEKIENIGQEFPLEIISVCFDAIRESSSSITLKLLNKTIDINRPVISFQKCTFKLLKTEYFQIPYAFTIDLPVRTGHEIYGTITYKYKNKNLTSGVDIKYKEKES